MWDNETPCDGCGAKEPLHSSNESAMNLFSIINRYSRKGEYSLSDINSTAKTIGASLEDYYKVINVIIPMYIKVANGK